MRVLLDTHAMLWWLTSDPRLSAQARATIADGGNQLVWSIASSWEIAIKVGIGRLGLRRSLSQLFADIVSGQAVELLAVTNDHCMRLAELPLHHRDPIDRMLVAQAQAEDVPILTADAKLARYEVETRW